MGIPRCSRSWIYPLLIVLLGVLVYANTLDAPFVFDDDYYIAENPATRDFGYFLDTSRMEQGIARGQLDQNFRSRRVTIASFTVNYRLDGLRVRGYHIGNLLLHLINGLLVYWLVLLILRTPFMACGSGDEDNRGYGHRPALLVALFFVAHPVQTEAVTYIAQRFTTMATLFYLLAVDLFLRWRIVVADQSRALGVSRSISRRWLPPVLYGLAWVSAVIAMFTKEIAFTLPLMMVFLEGIFFGWPTGRRLWRLVPFLLTLLIIPATILVAGANYPDMVSLTSSLNQPWSGNQAFTYLLTQFRVLVTYLRLLLLPLGQNIDYDYPRYTGFFQPPVLASFVFLCLLVGGAVSLYRRSVQNPAGVGRWQRLIALGTGWFFLTLTVESTIIPLHDLIFEHRLYLPSVGFFLVVWGGAEIARARFPSLRTIGSMLLAALLVVMATMAFARNNLWRDPVALWEDTVRKSPDKGRPHINLAKEYSAVGRQFEAERELLRSVELDKTNALAYLNLGILYTGLGKIGLALEALDRAASLDPTSLEVYGALGRALMLKGDYPAAVSAFQASLQLNPDDDESRRKLEELRRILGDPAAEMNTKWAVGQKKK